MKTAKCFSCGGEYPDIEGPTHRYMKSSPGCWAIYGEVLAREYENPKLMEVHRLSVDAYAVQHPGGKDRQSIQSVGVHLIRLCLFLEYNLAPEKTNDAMLKAAKHKHNYIWLKPPESLGSITVADVHKAKKADKHKKILRAWAMETWNAWSAYHDIVRTWANLKQNQHIL